MTSLAIFRVWLGREIRRQSLAPAAAQSRPSNHHRGVLVSASLQIEQVETRFEISCSSRMLYVKCLWIIIMIIRALFQNGTFFISSPLYATKRI